MPPPWPAPSGCRTSPRPARSPATASSTTASTAATAAPAPSTSPSPAAPPRPRCSSPSPTPPPPSYFSQVFGNGDQALTRSAEAEYNLPLPLGSPLNYFGGDYSQTNNLTHIEYWDEIAWPTDYNMTVHAPVNTPVQHRHLGRPELRSAGPTPPPSSPTASAARPAASSRSARAPSRERRPPRPPDYDRLTNVPTNTPCNAFATSVTNGRWESTTVWNVGSPLHRRAPATGSARGATSPPARRRAPRTGRTPPTSTAACGRATSATRT